MPLIKRFKNINLNSKKNLGLVQKSISIKNSIFWKYIDKKDSHMREELHQKYKNYRNIAVT